MKRLPLLLYLLLLVAAPVFITGTAFASNLGNVAATVTPQNISVNVTDGAVTYGTLGLSLSQDTTAAALNDTQTATNNGNVAETFNITSTNATGGTGWTLAGTIGADAFKHSFCNTGTGTPDPCDATPTWTAMTTSYSTLGTNIAAAGTSKFDLKLDTPSSTSDYTAKTITVTVQAIAF